MKKLFLASSLSDSYQFLEAFAEESLKGKTVTFIPTASLVERYKAYIDEDKEVFHKLGMIIEELELSTATAEEVEATIKRNDYIYVAGGNTFYLLQEVQKTGADKVIIEEVKRGKVYIGTSAGAILVAPDITYSEAMDRKEKAPELKNHKGLGLMKEYPLPHYTNKPFKEAVEIILNDYQNKLPLIPYSNTQVLEVKGDSYQVRGEQSPRWGLSFLV